MRRSSPMVLGAVLVALLAACTSAPPKPEPAATTPVPVVTEAQITTIMTALTGTLEVADAALDSDAVAARLEGPALDVRRADYVVAAAGHELSPVTIERDARWTVVAQTTTWPRVVLVSTTQPDDLIGTARILVLRQDSPRDQYRLWGSAGLGSGISVPEMTVPEVGSQLLPPNHKNLPILPADVLPWYADVLKNGDASEHVESFVGTDKDGMRAGLEATRRKIGERIGNGPGKYEETIEAPEEPAVVLATADGGALVVGRLTTTVQVKEIDVGATADDPMMVRVAALAGGTLTSSMTWGYTDVVVFKVPPEATKPVVVVAYAHTVTSAAPL